MKRFAWSHHENWRTLNFDGTLNETAYWLTGMICSQWTHVDITDNFRSCILPGWGFDAGWAPDALSARVGVAKLGWWRKCDEVGWEAEKRRTVMFRSHCPKLSKATETSTCIHLMVSICFNKFLGYYQDVLDQIIGGTASPIFVTHPKRQSGWLLQLQDSRGGLRVHLLPAGLTSRLHQLHRSLQF